MTRCAQSPFPALLSFSPCLLPCIVCPTRMPEKGLEEGTSSWSAEQGPTQAVREIEMHDDGPLFLTECFNSFSCQTETVISVPINGESVPIAKIRPKMAMIFTCKWAPPHHQSDARGSLCATGQIRHLNPHPPTLNLCRNCETRQMKQFSKLAYEKGIVIVKCSGCDKRHLIADNLGECAARLNRASHPRHRGWTAALS